MDGSALESGDIENGAAVVTFYDGTDFFLISGNDRAARAGDNYTGTHDFSGSGQVTLPGNTSIGNVSAAEIAVLDGLTASTAELNVLDGITASTEELNVLDGIAVTVAELNSVVDRAPKESPALTGTPTAPTAASGTNNQQIATTAFVVQIAFQAALPAQAGEPAGAGIITDGDGNAVWTPPASQSEMEAGTENSIRTMTPQRIAQAIAALATGNEATFAADGTITAAGKAVLLGTNGKVKQSAIASASVTSASTFESAITNYTSCCYDPANDKFALFYRDAGNNGHGTAVIATLNGSSVCLVSGRYIMVRFETGSAFQWRLDSYDLDIETMGAW